MRRWLGAPIMLALLLWNAPSADASVIFQSSNSDLSAKAEFTITGTTLEIVLTNLDSSITASNQALTGLFFNLGSSAFTPVSATIPVGSSIIQGSCNNGTGPYDCSAATNVGGEFSYAFGGIGLTAGANQGLSSSGYLNDNTNTGNFGGPNLDNPDAINGANFAIVGASFVPFSGNNGLDNDPLIRSAVRFVLTMPSALQESAISNVYFTYGTNPENVITTNTTNTTTTTTTTGSQTTGSVPEPTMLALFGAGLTMAARRLRRRTAA